MLMLMPTMATMDMVLPTMVMDMPTMDTTDTHMPTVDTTMARDLLMLSQRLMLMLTTDMPIHMPTMDTTTARDLLMLSQRLMLTTDTIHMPMVLVTITDMPTMDIMDTHMPTTVTDTTTKMFFKS